MTITASVQQQLFGSSADELIRIPPTVIMTTNLQGEAPKTPFIKTKRRLNIWTVEEHERFLLGLEQFPQGPWKSVAAVVGTKTTRQTMTHAQKYRQKIRRVLAGQSIKINNIPSTPVLSVEANVDTIPSSPNTVDTGIWMNDGSCAVGWLEDWEMETLLAEFGSPTDLDLGDLGIDL